jgi:hypothetical protein
VTLRPSNAIAIAAILALTLSACTGSSEGGRLDPRLILAGTVTAETAPPTCTPPGPSFTTAGPALILLSTAQLEATLTEGRNVLCARIAVANLPAPAFEARSKPDGSEAYVTIPQAGEWRVYDPTLTQVGTSFATPPGATAFCPTRLTVGQDATRIAVLDDPTVPGSGCSSTTRNPTVRIYDLSSDSRPLIATLQSPISLPVLPPSRSGSPMEIAILNNNLFVLTPTTANTYQLYRFDLNSPSLGSTLGTPLFTNAAPTRLDLNPVATPVQSMDLRPGASNLLLTYTTSGGGATVTIAPDSGTVTPLATRAEDTETTTPVGPGIRILFDSLTSTTTVLRSAGSLFIRPDNTAVQATAASDVTIPPDGFAYLTGLSAGSLARQDVSSISRGLPGDARNLSLPNLSSTTTITWVVDPTLPNGNTPQ